MDVALIFIVGTLGKNCSAAAAIVALCLTFAAVHAAVLQSRIIWSFVAKYYYTP